MGNDRYNQNSTKNPYRIDREPVRETAPTSFSKTGVDFETQRICPSCGKAIKIGHNFCKFCGVDLNSIRVLGHSDKILKELANTGLTDPDPDVRKDAVDTLGDLGETEVLGVLAYILLNDSDESVRKKSADRLGDFHHPYSLDVLVKALKDKSSTVRKGAIESLKKIKKKNKPEKKVEVEIKEEKASEKIEDEEESEEDTLKEIEVEDEDS